MLNPVLFTSACNLLLSVLITTLYGTLVPPAVNIHPRPLQVPCACGMHAHPHSDRTEYKHIHKNLLYSAATDQKVSDNPDYSRARHVEV